MGHGLASEVADARDDAIPQGVLRRLTPHCRKELTMDKQLCRSVRPERDRRGTTAARHRHARS